MGVVSAIVETTSDFALYNFTPPPPVRATVGLVSVKFCCSGKWGGRVGPLISHHPSTAVNQRGLSFALVIWCLALGPFFGVIAVIILSSTVRTGAEDPQR